MSREHKDVVRRYFSDVLSTERLETAAEILAPDFTCIDATGAVIRGIDAFTEMLRAVGASFPHRDVVVGDLVAEDDTVIAVFELRMEHVGEYLGHPPTGRLVEITGVDVFHFEAGRIRDLRVFYNPLIVLEQLGIPAGAG